MLITIPLIVLAALATVGGVISLPGNSWLSHYLAPIFNQKAHVAHHFGPTEYMLMAVAVAGGLIGIGIAFAKYLKKGSVPEEDAQITGFSKVLYNKYYVDELYMMIIVRPINALSTFLRTQVETAIAGFVLGLGKATHALGTKGRAVQNGNIGFYLFAFVLGVCLILFYLFLAQ